MLINRGTGKFYSNFIMNLSNVLKKNVICMDLPGRSKEEVVKALLDVAMTTGKIKNRDAALKSILERENKMSTGIQAGIAIPHGKTDAVDELVACIAIKREGVDFDSLDGNPSRIFIMTLSPADRIGPHVQFLAEISRLLKQKEAREQMLSAGSVDELLDFILNREGK